MCQEKYELGMDEGVIFLGYHCSHHISCGLGMIGDEANDFCQMGTMEKCDWISLYIKYVKLETVFDHVIILFNKIIQKITTMWYFFLDMVILECYFFKVMPLFPSLFPGGSSL